MDRNIVVSPGGVKPARWLQISTRNIMRYANPLRHRSVQMRVRSKVMDLS